MTQTFQSTGSILENPNPYTLVRRPRRNRHTLTIRNLVQETYLQPHQLIAPLFVVEGHSQHQIIPSMPGVFRYSIDTLLVEIGELYQAGIRAIDLFSYIPVEKKDEMGSEALREGNFLHKAIQRIKQEFPEICVMTDIALDPFTSHGHDGLMNGQGMIDNDATLPILGKMSLLAAEAGVDIIAPSDMMDGRVAYIRSILDSGGFSSVGILSYAAKYASAFYSPFRDALQSTLKFGDKKGYQINPCNVREALLECQLDEQEGADMLLIKPGLPCLDIIAKVREITSLPIGAYQVSGEYSMIMAAAQQGWIDGPSIFEESLIAIKRAGADFIFTYAAKSVANRLKQRSV